MKNRHSDNIKILNILYKELLSQPDIRFGQALRNLGIVREALDDRGVPTYWVNEFNTEPQEMLRRIRGRQDKK